MCPLDACTAMMAAAEDWPASARSAAVCTPPSMVVRTGVPGCPSHFFSTATWCPAAFSATIMVCGVPASMRW